ncbi:flagellar associated protein, putative (macronuclear) [Tetrahymena thermophila SB210]|uniref:Flagellar associated protein, putative n=1 Tax=Tetrahymena thermophila (strain SB210) TaxID=312017 RepID=Q235Y4_TETTS|nr:flagellar associated protein, putative [Tetrahymena thermophila SB210]EAR92616.3 flagellar associated protein, putative [Tetrahymena thermophila SB210]|eukprot:XP_001012861.3 flagellar associated protein, putative [Tetrahymena thermophila SB210]
MGDIYEDISFGQQVFDQLEADFRRIIDELAGEQSLERFRVEYEKLHRALRTSYENEKKQLARIKELNDDIVQHAAKLQMALKLTQEDTDTIQMLKTELEKAYKVLETSRDREEKSKGKIEKLQTEIKHLTQLNETSNNPNMYKNETVEKLTKQNEELKAASEEFQKQLALLRNALNDSTDKLKQIQNETSIIKSKIKEETKQKQEIDEKVNKDNDRCKKIEEELKILKDNHEKEDALRKKMEDENKQLENTKASNQIEYQARLDEIKKLDQNKKQLENDKISLEIIEKELKRKKEECEIEYKQREVEKKQREKELHQRHTESDQLKKEIDKLEAKKQQATQQKENSIRSKQMVIQSATQLERQVFDTKKLNEEDLQLIKELKNARELLERSLQKTDKQNKEQGDKIKKLDREITEKEKEIREKGWELDQMKRQLGDLEKEKEKFGKQAAQANAEYFRRLEEIKLKDNLISEFQKKNVETEAKLKRQQTLYEAVRSAKNLYSKNLSETQDEIAEIKRRYKITNHQISQLKEEIDAKEIALAKEHFEHKKKDKTIEEHAHILEKNKKDIDRMQEEIKNFKGEINKLQFIIKESEGKRAKLKEEYEVVVSERDILGTQLIRRNDESALLYEQIKIQQRTLAEGEKAYREREGDIQLLEYKKNDLVRSLRIYKKQVSDIPDLKNNIKNLRKELIEEQLKVKALSQELESPMNESRCRKLEGSDPDVFEMRQKLQTLQRRLISKTEQVVEKEVLIQQKEKQVQELREIMQKQPGPEEAKMLSSLQQNLKQRTRQMKALAAELNMYQAQVLITISNQILVKVLNYNFNINRQTNTSTTQKSLTKKSKKQKENIQNNVKRNKFKKNKCNMLNQNEEINQFSYIYYQRKFNLKIKHYKPLKQIYNVCLFLQSVDILSYNNQINQFIKNFLFFIYQFLKKKRLLNQFQQQKKLKLQKFKFQFNQFLLLICYIISQQKQQVFKKRSFYNKIMKVQKFSVFLFLI